MYPAQPASRPGRAIVNGFSDRAAALEEAGWRVHVDDPARDVHVGHDGGHEGNLDDAPLGRRDGEAILGAAGDDAGHLAKRDPTGVERGEALEIFRPVLVLVEGAALAGIDRERDSAEGLGGMAARDLTEPQQNPFAMRPNLADFEWARRGFIG